MKVKISVIFTIYHVLYIKAQLMVYYCGYVLLSFEENYDFRFLDQKMPSPYEMKLLFKANMRSVINIV